MARPTKITVATVTWNAGTVLERTLLSVEEQDYADVQHVIVDGASSDDTLTMVRLYQERNTHPDREITLLSEPDHGLYDAMNKAIQLAEGDYIIFLNAGDKFHEASTLSKVVAFADNAPAVLYGDTDIVDNNGRFLRKRHLRPPRELSWRSFKRGMLVCHQAFFARVDIAKKTPYDTNYRFSADYDWCIRIMKEARDAGLLLRNTQIVVADYLDGGMTTKNHRRSLIERLKIMAKHYGWLTAVGMHISFLWRAAVNKVRRLNDYDR